MIAITLLFEWTRWIALTPLHDLVMSRITRLRRVLKAARAWRPFLYRSLATLITGLDDARWVRTLRAMRF